MNEKRQVYTREQQAALDRLTGKPAEEPRMNDHADTLRKLRRSANNYAAACGGDLRAEHLAECDALDAAIAALEAGRSEVVLAQLRRELSADKGWGGDYTEYEKGRIAEKERCISLLAAAPQQPPPVGDYEARAYLIFRLQQMLDAGPLGFDAGAVRETLQYLSQQEAAPSVSEFGAFYVCPTCHGTGNVTEQVHDSTVSEPAASENECTCSDMQAAHGHHFGCPVLHTPDAASGEGSEWLAAWLEQAARLCVDVPDELADTLTLEHDGYNTAIPGVSGDVHDRLMLAAALIRRLTTTGQPPIPMLLFCPKCSAQHVDEPDERTPGWDNPPHRSHLCHACGHIWRPADVATTGVASLTTVGSRDGSPIPATTGDVERLVGAAIALADEHDTLHGECVCGGHPACAACQLREALAPFGQQQEGQ